MKILLTLALFIPLTAQAGRWLDFEFVPAEGSWRTQFYAKYWRTGETVGGRWIYTADCGDTCKHSKWQNGKPRAVMWTVRAEYLADDGNVDNDRSEWADWVYISYPTEKAKPVPLPVAFTLSASLYNGGFKCWGPSIDLDYSYEEFVSGSWIFAGFGQMNSCESGPIAYSVYSKRWRIEYGDWVSDWVMISN